MITFFGSELIELEWSSSTVCIGVFDGVHLGHREVISTAVSRAKAFGEPCVLVTFDRHPASVLAPAKVPLPVASLNQNLEQFASLGVGVCIVLTFDEEMAHTSAANFFDNFLIEKLRASHIVVGHDFAFGKGREGDSNWLKNRIETIIVPAFELEHHRVSSSSIRRAVSEGEVLLARTLIGRPFSLRGIVAHGEKLGRTLGYPTINLALPSKQVVPKDGIYNCRAKTPLGEFQAATSIGKRPSVGGVNRTIEAYLLDFPSREIYGSVVDLDFLQRIRDEETFESIEALTRQIGLDVEKVRRLSNSA